MRKVALLFFLVPLSLWAAKRHPEDQYCADYLQALKVPNIEQLIKKKQGVGVRYVFGLLNPNDRQHITLLQRNGQFIALVDDEIYERSGLQPATRSPAKRWNVEIS